MLDQMLDFLIEFSRNTWELVAEMAAYLLFGFIVAGLLHVLIRREFIQRWLGKPGIGGVVKATALGVPMPLCSCSVIPVAASLRKSGASRGATASFLSSTPQTGVDSILATYALLGGVFTLVRVAVAFVCGIVTGYLIELFCKGTSAPKQTFTPATPATFQSFSPIQQVSASNRCCAAASKPKRKIKEALRYGLLTLPADLANALIIGLLLAGLITTLIPDTVFTGALSSGPQAFLIATLISLPLYVCATASIPMAYALLAAGLSPGAALVFLITGPATNTATVVTVWKMLGRGATAIYLASLLVIAWIAGWLFNATLYDELNAPQHTQHAAHAQLAFWEHASGVLLLTLLLYNIYKRQQSKAPSCCSK